MIIKLISAEMYCNIHKNIHILESYLSKHNDADLLVFGESFLQGFDSLCWNYSKDIDTAVAIESNIMNNICSLSRKYNVAISFGFYESYKNNIYSSNIVIDNSGNIINIYRRISNTWTIPGVSNEYKTGNDFTKFQLYGKQVVVAICGDLWFEDNIDKINQLAPDLILWPLYIDYSKEEWKEIGENDYNQQISKLKAPVLMINSYSLDINGALGGAYVFDKGQIQKCLQLGNIGTLIV